MKKLLLTILQNIQLTYNKKCYSLVKSHLWADMELKSGKMCLLASPCLSICPHNSRMGEHTLMKLIFLTFTKNCQYI